MAERTTDPAGCSESSDAEGNSIVIKPSGQSEAECLLLLHRGHVLNQAG